MENFQSLKFNILLFLTSHIVISCGRSPDILDGLIYSGKDVEKAFTITKVSNLENMDDVVWNNNWIKLVSNDDGNIQKFKNLVMVSFNYGSIVSNIIRNHPHTLIFFKGKQDLIAGFALVEVSDFSQLHYLSELLHHDSGFGCGKIERISLTTTIAKTLIDYIPPVFREDTKLSQVSTILERPSQTKLKEFIQTLQDLGTRYHTTTKGLAAPAKIEDLMRQHVGGLITDLSYNQKVHSATSQTSLVVTIPGTDQSETNVIIGAHLDSINSKDQETAPGADDDASGIATMIEVLRIIAEEKLTFKRTIEFHAYAAEEVGLIGSQDIAIEYYHGQKKVAAMLQLDMNAYSKDSSSTTIFLVQNDTSENLRRSLKELMKTYLGQDYLEKKLTAGTSDHKSWTNQGFHAVFPFEDPENFNLALHSKNDNLDRLNLSLTQRFTKLVLAFLGHHAGLNKADTAQNKDYISQATSAFENLPTDIALAVVNGDTTNYYRFAVGVANNVVRLETCQIAKNDNTDCQKQRFAMTYLGEKNNRNVHYLDHEQLLESQQLFRFFGYDANDQLVFVRSVKIEQK